MILDYFYCSHCGYEDHDIFVAYAHKYANGDSCYCPECQEEVLCE